MATRLQLRRDTAVNWTTANPILLDGEMAVETDTGKFKVGDGTTVWTSLVYSSGTQGEPGVDGATWFSDSVDPTTEGIDGDFFLNTTSYDIFKKVSEVWTLIGNIKGATGDTGPQGETGDSTKAFSFYIDGELTVGTNLLSVLSPLGLTITGIRASVDVAPTDASLIIDINKNGTTLYTTQANRPTFLTTETSVTATLPDVTSISLGDKISLDIDQIGSTLPGENLSVIVICEVV